MSFNGDDGVLSDVTNKVASVQIDEELLKRVKDTKWAEPQKFDYDTYNAATGKAAPIPETNGQEEDNEFGHVPTWASNATKYEWQAEYGEVGPSHDVLEKMLFGDPHQMEQGSEFSK